MPIAVDNIQEKLLRREFKNLTDLESYFKRMISNAKEYNTRGSELYDDAERLRKALSNFMTKTNPAYKLIPGYVAAPTPLPNEGGQASDLEDAEGEPDSEAEAAVQAKKIRSRPKPPPKSKSHTPKQVSTPAAVESRPSRAGFSKLTFQQAQEKILEDLITLKEQPESVMPLRMLWILANKRTVMILLPLKYLSTCLIVVCEITTKSFKTQPVYVRFKRKSRAPQ